MFYNSWTLIGRMVKDPELNYTPGGKAVARVRLAVDRDFKNADGERDTDFFDVITWEKQAEFMANYGKKGRLLLAEGRAQYREWQRDDNSKGHVTEMIAAKIRFMDSDRKAEAPPVPEEEESR